MAALVGVVIVVNPRWGGRHKSAASLVHYDSINPAKATNGTKHKKNNLINNINVYFYLTHCVHY